MTNMITQNKAVFKLEFKLMPKTPRSMFTPLMLRKLRASTNFPNSIGLKLGVQSVARFCFFKNITSMFGYFGEIEYRIIFLHKPAKQIDQVHTAKNEKISANNSNSSQIQTSPCISPEKTTSS